MEEDPLQAYLETGNNLFKNNKINESLTCFEQILISAFDETNFDENYFDIFEQTINNIRLIALKCDYNRVQQISDTYDEFLMHKQKLAYIPDKEKREKLIHTRCINAAQELLPHLQIIKEKLSNVKRFTSKVTLGIGFIIGAISASIITYYIVKKNRSK